jgi:hypothetical protein
MKVRNKLQKNKIKWWFDCAPGNTTELKKECAEVTGLTYRTIQSAYSNPHQNFNLDTLVSFAHFFSLKYGRIVTIEDLLYDGKSDVVKASHDAFNHVPVKAKI